MDFLQGNTYKLGIKLRDASGRIVTDNGVRKAQFWFNGLEKLYDSESIGDIFFNQNLGLWVVPLSEDETFAFAGVVEWQARVMMDTGKIAGMRPKAEYLYDSEIKTKMSNGGV